MMRRIALLTTLLALAIAVPAHAQGDAFGPLPSADTPVPTATATSTTTDDGSTSKKVLFLIGGALIIGFGAMGYLIMRDARAAVPEEGPQLRDRARTSTSSTPRPRPAPRRASRSRRARPRRAATANAVTARRRREVAGAATGSCKRAGGIRLTSPQLRSIRAVSAVIARSGVDPQTPPGAPPAGALKPVNSPRPR